MLNRWLHRLTMTFSLLLSSSCDAIADPPTVTAKSVEAAGAEFQATDAESNGLTIRMDVDRVSNVPTIDYDEGFRVVLTNNSEQPLRICNPETQAGYFQLSFQFTNPATGEKLVVRKRQIEDSRYWESVVKYLEPGHENIVIAPANSFTIEVRLNAFRTWTALPDPNSSTRYPIIMGAVAFPEIMQLLIAHGADLDTRITWRGWRSGAWIIGDDATILHYAADNGVPETITMLIDSGVDLFATVRDPIDEKPNQTALEVAAECGYGVNAEAIIKHPKFIAAPPEIRQALLDKCLLIGASSNWDFRDSQRLKLIQVLVEAGADPNVMKDGVTPMLTAASEIHPNSRVENGQINRIIAYLIEHGATVDFFSAVAIGDLDRVRHMLETNPGLASTRRPDGYPVLHLAVGMDNREIVSALLKAGCDVDIRNKSDNTGSEDETALHNAAFWGRAELAVLLIESGADVNALDEHHGTPLDEARRLKNKIVEDLLLKHGATSGTRR